MKRPALLLAGVLLFLSFSIIGYRIIWLRYPLFPPGPGKAWELTMEAWIKGGTDKTAVMIGLPSGRGGKIVTEERIHSGSLLFNLLREDPNQVGVWSGTIGSERDFISYHAIVLVNSQDSTAEKPPPLGPFPEPFGREEQTLARRLADGWIKLDPGERLRAAAAAAGGNWRSSRPDAKDMEGWADLQRRHGRLHALLLLLRAAGLPARPVEGLRLADGVTNTPLRWIEVWAGKGWENLWPETGTLDQTSGSLLPLSVGANPAVKVLYGEVEEIRWSVSQRIVSQWQHHFERIKRSERLLDRWSLFRLPTDFQETFRILLLVPIGALLICLLRNLVGFPTFGIFMPVLMALAFRNTGLAYGLLIFAGVVVIGFLVRRMIDRLHLLLVPRLSVILTMVILFFTALALVGSELGVRKLMAVGLLPFVILTMTIERFFVINEEAGSREALRTAAGSAAVAAITHEILRFEPLQLTFFVFPELLFAVGALQILVGRYTGYRISEFFRFRKVKIPS